MLIVHVLYCIVYFFDKSIVLNCFSFQLDLRAKHMCDILINTLNVFIWQPNNHSLPIYYQEAGQIIKYFCTKLSILFVKLLSNPLISPYIIRAHNKFIEAIMCSKFTIQEWDSSFNHELQIYTPMIYWWSIRILRPVRLMHFNHSLCSLLLSKYSTTKTFDQSDQFITKQAVEDSISLTMCWSSQSIGDHTKRIFSLLCDKVNQTSKVVNKIFFLKLQFRYVFLFWQ